jgi:subtilisin family serine protease
MKLFNLVIIAFLVLSSNLSANECQKQLKVAIVDTGLDLNDPRFKNHLCKTGHKNFVHGEPLNDLMGHGTHVAGSIVRYSDTTNYCLLIYKYYSENEPGLINLQNEVSAFKEAVKNGADIVNFSGGGPEFSEEEYLTIKKHPKVTFVVAAGNEGVNIDLPSNYYYPASYFLKNISIVSSIEYTGELAKTSNWSKKHPTYKQFGVNILSTLPPRLVKDQIVNQGYMSGTSMATAIITGKLVTETQNLCK